MPGIRAFRGWGGSIFLVLACGVLAPIAAPPVRAGDAGAPKQQRVLALYVATPGGPVAVAFEAFYQKRFAAALGSRLDFQSEFIDLSRFGEPGYQAALVAFLGYKYRRLPPDVIIATTEGARQFVERFRDDLFPRAAVVFIDRVTTRRPGPGMTGVTAPFDMGATIDLALTLQPDTSRVFVVSGVSEYDRPYERVAREQLKRFAGRVQITYLSGQSIAAIEQTLARLPPHSIIYFLTFGQDRAGARFRSIDVLDRVAVLANAPIYSWNTATLNRGTVGGHLYANDVAAEHSAVLTLRILAGEKPETIPPVAIDAYLNQLDWRQLRRWGISEARVPAGTAIMFREPTLWDRYKGYVAASVALVLVQAGLIAGLLVQRRRGRQMAAAMRDNQARLEAGNRQITDLFGRLMTAQETERGRIARDLHDDVSQRIAGLSIMISALKNRMTNVPVDPEVMQSIAAMQRNTIGLADEIRQVSHDLHPSLLQHSGLVAALRQFCEQFETLQGTPVTYTADAGIGDVDHDTRVCLYRIAQEALRNVAKHAAATRVDVALTRTAEGLQLTVADDGTGFDLAGTRLRAGGLGLVSIDERVRLLRGSVAIETRPRGGTRLTVLIPLRSAEPQSAGGMPLGA